MCEEKELNLLRLEKSVCGSFLNKKIISICFRGVLSFDQNGFSQTSGWFIYPLEELAYTSWTLEIESVWVLD